MNDVLKFGKYAGLSIQDVPSDYVEWMLRKTNEDYRMWRSEQVRRALLGEHDGRGNMVSPVETIINLGHQLCANRLCDATPCTQHEPKCHELKARYASARNALLFVVERARASGVDFGDDDL